MANSNEVLLPADTQNTETTDNSAVSATSEEKKEVGRSGEVIIVAGYNDAGIW